MLIGHALSGFFLTLLIVLILPNAFIGGLYLVAEGQIDYENVLAAHSKVTIGLIVVFPALISLLIVGTWYFSRNLQWEVSPDGLVVTKLGSEPERYGLTAVLLKERKGNLRILEAGQPLLKTPVLHRLPLVSEDHRIAFTREFQRLKDKQSEPIEADQLTVAVGSTSE